MANLIRTLEHAATARLPLLVELHDGRRFADGVCEVLHQYGEHYVVFHANNRLVVRDIARAEPLDQGDADIECRDAVDHAWSAL